MIMLFDSHAHIQDDSYDNDRDEVISRALENGVLIINIGTDKESSWRAVEIARLYPEGVYSAIGIHPCDGMDEEFDRDFFIDLAKDKSVVAIGETGIDYHGMNYESGIMNEGARIKEKQRELFLKHIELAIELDMPLVVHCRNSKNQNDAHEDVLRILDDDSSGLRGVVHSFSGTKDDARRYRALGFRIAFNGIITFAREYDDAVLETPLEDILIETDAPYLTPVPFRGKRNEPIYVKQVAEKIAEIKGMSLDDVAWQTTENARNLFRI